MAIMCEFLDDLYVLDKKDILVICLVLVITWLIYLLQRRPHEANVGQNFTVTSSGHSGLISGVCKVENLSIEQCTNAKEPLPDLELILASMQAVIRGRYKELKIRGLPWLPEVEFTLKECFVQLALTDGGTKLALNEIFNTTETSTKPRRILIQGGAGFGKTTLTCKLCYDWVNNADYMAFFKLVIVLHLRNFKTNFRDTLAATLDVDTYSNIDAVVKTIEQNAENTLLVLEGYDEIPEAAEKYLRPILKRNEMEHVTVIVTSRPGKFMAGRIFYDEWPVVVEGLSHCFDKKIDIMGLLQENQQEFLKIHLRGCRPEKLQNVCDHLKHMVPTDFLACPLFLLMLAFVFKEGNIKNVNSKTKLFKKVLNYIVRCFLSRPTTSYSGKNLPGKANIFKFSPDNPPNYVKLLSALGNLAISALEKDRLVFTQRELLKLCDDSRMLLEIGLLNPTAEVNGIWHKIYYEPVHKSILEFLAAFSLWVSFFINPDTFEKTFYSKKLVRPTQETTSSLLFPFLCGLFGNDCSVLVNCLHPFSSEYSSWFGSLRPSIEECIMTPDIKNSFEPLFPVEWIIPWSQNDREFARTSTHQILLQNALQSGHTEILKWFLDSPAMLPNKIKVKVLILVLGASIHLSDSKYDEIECTELWCDLRIPGSCSEEWTILMNLIQHIEMETISFVLCTTYSYVWLPFVHKAALSQKFRGKRIYRLHCWIKCEQAHTLSLISDLVQAENVIGLNLLIIPSSLLSPVFDTLRTAICNMTKVPASSTGFKGTDPLHNLPLDEHKVNQASIKLLHTTEMDDGIQGYEHQMHPSSLVKQTTIHSEQQLCSEQIKEQSQADLSLACAGTSTIALHQNDHQQLPVKSSAEVAPGVTEYIDTLGWTECSQQSLEPSNSSLNISTHSAPMSFENAHKQVLESSYQDMGLTSICSTDMETLQQERIACVSETKSQQDVKSNNSKLRPRDDYCLSSTTNNTLSVAQWERGSDKHHEQMNCNTVTCQDGEIQHTLEHANTLHSFASTSSNLISLSQSIISDLSSETDWMKTFDELSIDLPAFVDIFRTGLMRSLECTFGNSPEEDTDASEMVQNSFDVVKDHIFALCGQTTTLMKNTASHNLPSSASSIVQFMSKMQGTYKIFTLLYSVLTSKPKWSFLKKFENLDKTGSIERQMANLIRLIVLILGSKPELEKEVASDTSKHEQLVLLVKSVGGTLSSEFKELRSLLTEKQYMDLVTTITVACDLFSNISEFIFAPYSTHVLPIDCLSSFLSYLNTVSFFLLSVMEDTVFINALKTLAQKAIPELCTILSLCADMLESIDDTHIDDIVSKFDWVKNALCMCFSFVTLLSGFNHETSPIVSRALNTLFDTISIAFPTLLFVVTILLEVVGTTWSEITDVKLWDELYSEFFSGVHTWTSNVLQLPASSRTLSVERMTWMNSSVTISPYSEQYNHESKSNRCDFLPVSQLDFDSFISAASKSKQLTSFAVTNFGTVPLSMCMDTLCNSGKKSWIELKIIGDILLHFNNNMLAMTIKSNHLDVRIHKAAVNDEEFMKYFLVNSLHCSQHLIIDFEKKVYCAPETIQELNVYLSSALNIVPAVKSLINMHTLAITLASFEKDSKRFSVKELLPMFSVGSKLKRLEIWNVNTNPTLASCIVEEVVEASRKVHAEILPLVSNCEEDSTSNKLECLMLQVDVDIPTYRTVTSIMRERFKQSKILDDVKHIMEHPERRLLDLVALLKYPVKNKLISCLELVCVTKPPSWENIFPYDEGFRIEHLMIKKEVRANRIASHSHLEPFMEHQFVITHES